MAQAHGNYDATCLAEAVQEIRAQERGAQKDFAYLAGVSAHSVMRASQGLSLSHQTVLLISAALRGDASAKLAYDLVQEVGYDFDDLGCRFLDALEARGLSQSEAAREMGVHAATVNRFCVGCANRANFIGIFLIEAWLEAQERCIAPVKLDPSCIPTPRRMLPDGYAVPVVWPLGAGRPRVAPKQDPLAIPSPPRPSWKIPESVLNRAKVPSRWPDWSARAAVAVLSLGLMGAGVAAFVLR